MDAVAAITPRKDAKIWLHRNSKGPTHPNNENLRQIHKSGHAVWKKEGDRLLSMPSDRNRNVRIKTIFTGEMCARMLESQATEMMIECKTLNKMMQIGMPESCPVAA